MKLSHRMALLASLIAMSASHADDERAKVYFLKLPASESKALGQIERLSVTVACGWISGLRNIPELYDIEMGYDMPTVNVLEARPRLGGAAVALSRWNGVVGVLLPENADQKSCFNVEVLVEGRTGAKRQWSGQQLGLPKY